MVKSSIQVRNYMFGLQGYLERWEKSKNHEAGKTAQEVVGDRSRGNRLERVCLGGWDGRGGQCPAPGGR